jgi:hypothetical protein
LKSSRPRIQKYRKYINIFVLFIFGSVHFKRVGILIEQVTRWPSDTRQFGKLAELRNEADPMFQLVIYPGGKITGFRG